MKDYLEMEVPDVDGVLRLDFFKEGDARKAFDYFASRGIKVTYVAVTQTREPA